MKKTIAILLILVIGMVGVFAAVDDNTDSLKLYTKVDARYGLVISDTEASGSGTLALLASFEDLEPIESVEFIATGDDAFKSGDLYVNYMTNQAVKAIVSTNMSPLTSGELTTKIGYKVTIDGVTNPIVVAESASAAVPVEFITESNVTQGMRVATKKFSILLNSDDWNLANAADEYSTTWTVTLTII